MASKIVILARETDKKNLSATSQGTSPNEKEITNSHTHSQRCENARQNATQTQYTSVNREGGKKQKQQESKEKVIA